MLVFISVSFGAAMVRRLSLLTAFLMASALIIAGCSAGKNNSSNQSAIFTTINRAPVVSIAAGAEAVYGSNKTDGGSINFRRSDGLPAQSNIYSAGQIIKDGNRLVFTEYWPDVKTTSSRQEIVYPLGGSIRTFVPNQSVKTLLRSKSIDASKRPIRGIAVNGDQMIFTRGEAIWSFNSRTARYTALVGSLDQEGNINGSGAKVRFAHPQSLARKGNTLYIADRDNYAIRTLDLENGKVKTFIELNYKPQNVLVTGDKLWISGSNLATVDLNCKSDCSSRSHALWFDNNIQTIALTRDDQGRLITTAKQGVFRFNPNTKVSERLASPDTVVRNEKGAIAFSKLFSATGAAVIDDVLYYVDGTNMIGNFTLPQENK